MTKMNTMTLIALCLIFLGGIGAILLTIGQSISSSKDKSEIIKSVKIENDALKNDIKELKDERVKLGLELLERDSLLQTKNDTIINLNEKLSDKSEYIQNYLTGGDGYPVVEIEKFATDNFADLTGMFNVKIVSKFPIYNLRINIYDYDLLKSSFEVRSFTKNPVITSYNFAKAKILAYKIEELTPSQTQFLDTKIKLKEVRYFVQLRARNEVYIQKIASIIDNTFLYYGYQIFTLSGTLKEQNFGDNTSREVKDKLIKKLNTISIKNNFDLVE